MTQEQGRPGALRAVLSVFWAFFGVRKSKDAGADLTHLKPAHVIIAGIVLAVVFVTTLVTLVGLITGK